MFKTLNRNQLDRLQAARIAEALLEVAAERGYQETTVADVVDRARISRRSYYDLFDSKEDAFMAARTMVLERAVRLVRVAVDGAEGPAAQVRAALAQAVALVQANPARTRLWVEDARRDGTVAMGVIEWGTELVAELGLEPALAPMPAADLLAAGFGLLRSRLERDPPELGDLLEALERLMLATTAGEDAPADTRRRRYPEIERIAAGLRGAPSGRGAAIDAVTECIVAATIYSDAAMLQSIRDRLSEALADTGRPRSEREALRRLDELSRAALDGGPAGILAVAGAVRAHGGEALQGMPLRVLRYLHENPSSTTTAIQEGLGERHPSAISRALRQLRDRGLASGAANGGTKLWALTLQGEAAS